MLWSWLFAPTTLIILAGLALEVLGPLLVKWGNLPNMGICVACFMRDIAGVLGLHRAGTVQYIHPEIIGFILGSFAAAYAFGEFRNQGGSSSLVHFLLGKAAKLPTPLSGQLRPYDSTINWRKGTMNIQSAFSRRSYG